MVIVNAIYSAILIEIPFEILHQNPPDLWL